jgi:hypothetical protein
MTKPATMQNEVMRWGHLPLAGESGAYNPADDDAERSDEVGAPPACGGEWRK